MVKSKGSLLWVQHKGNEEKIHGNHSIDALSVRPSCTKERGKYIGGRYKYRGRYKSLRDPLKKLWWKCGKPSHFKKNYRSKSVERGKGSTDNSSIENKSSLNEGGDVYLDSTST